MKDKSNKHIYVQSLGDNTYGCCIFGNNISIYNNDAYEMALIVEKTGATIRAFGDRDNAELVALAFGLSVPVQTVSPRFALGAKSGDVERLDRAQRIPDVAASLGGWHNVSAIEASACFVTDSIDRGDSGWESSIQQFVLMRVWDFIGPLDVRAVAEFVASVRDPRWFVDMDRPNRSSAARSYFGLSRSSDPLSVRRKSLWDCWRTSTSPWIRRLCGGNPGDVGPGEVERRVSRAVLKFMLGTWGNSVVSARRRVNEDPVWESSLFFDADDHRSFVEHMREVSRSLRRQ